jgi:signal transduction histidine kinase
MSEQFFLDWAGLAVSIFNTISLLWLGLTVLLTTGRRAVGAWLTGGGLLLGALFFTSHTAILGRGLASTSLGMDFWWWVSWGPAVAAPLAWYGVMLWYAGFHLSKPHPHRPWLIVTAALALGIVLLLLLANPVPSYRHFVGRELAPTLAVAGFPLLIPTYLGYSLLCFLLPLDLLRRADSAVRPLAAVARRRARPWLMAVSGLLLAAGVVMGWTALWVLQQSPPPTLANPDVATSIKRFDLAVAGLIAMAITLLGRAIVAYAAFTERPLPRRGFFRQWRSTVILAAGFGSVVAWAWTIQLRPLYSLMLAAVIMTVFHALFSWRSFVEREQFMAQMRPFVASQGLYDQVLDQVPPDPAALQRFFATLCRDVLGARSAVLVPAGSLATLAGPPLVYPASGAVPAIPLPTDMAGWFPSPELRCRPALEYAAAWAVGLWHEERQEGVLLLGEKANGNPYTEEEIEIAQAGGERLLDTLAAAEIARLAMRLLRQRIAQVTVLEGQGRRILHDQVLPQLHTAILYLSGLKDTPAAGQAVEVLAAAHRQIADLIHDAPAATPQALAEQDLFAALQSAMKRDFSGEFAAVAWQVSPEAAQAAHQLPLFVAEVVYFAAQELLRNAARHGRGGDEARRLRLLVRLELERDLRLVVEDDGVGFEAGLGAPEGSGSGLRFHSTMLAAVGGRLEVVALPGRGMRAVICLPAGVWGQEVAG